MAQRCDSIPTKMRILCLHDKRFLAIVSSLPARFERPRIARMTPRIFYIRRLTCSSTFVTLRGCCLSAKCVRTANRAVIGPR